MTRPQPGGQTIGTIAGVTDGTSNTLLFLKANRGSGGQSSIAISSDVYQGGPGSQWGLPTYVISNPGDFLIFTQTVTPQCVQYAQQNPTATWTYGGQWWSAGEYTNSVGNSNYTPNSQCSPTAPPGAASGPDSETSAAGAATRAASTWR